MKRLSKAYDEKFVAGLEKKDYTLQQQSGDGSESFEELISWAAQRMIAHENGHLWATIKQKTS